MACPGFFYDRWFFIKEEKLILPKSFILGKYKKLYLKIIYLYIPVLLLHNFFISIGFYDPNIIYHGVYVVQWDVWYYFKKILLALLFCGKEPLLDAMWFVYVLFLALCGLSLLSYFAKKICRDKINYLSLRFFVLLLLVTVSCILTKVYDTKFLHQWQNYWNFKRYSKKNDYLCTRKLTPSHFEKGGAAIGREHYIWEMRR